MSFLRKGILVSGGQMFGLFLNMLAGVIFARTLKPDGVGQLELFRTTGLIAATITCMGLGNANIFFLNNQHIAPERIVTNSIKITIGLSLPLMAVLIFAFLGFPDYFGDVSVVTAVTFAVGVSCLVGLNLLRPVLAAKLAARQMVSVDLFNRVVMLAAAGLLILCSLMKPQPAVMALAVSNSSSYILILFFLRKNINRGLRFDWPLFRRVLGYGIKLAAVNILFIMGYQITTMLLRYFQQNDFSSIGLYSRAVAVCSMVTMIPTSLGPLLYAKFASLRGESRARQAEMILRIVVFLAITMCLSVLLLGKYIIWLLYGKEFLPAYSALVLLAPGLLFMPLFSVCNNLLAGDGKAAVTSMVLLGTVIIITTLAVLTIPVMSIQGAALASLCGNMFTALATLMICRKFYGIRLRKSLVLTPMDARHMWNALWGHKRKPDVSESENIEA